MKVFMRTKNSCIVSKYYKFARLYLPKVLSVSKSSIKSLIVTYFMVLVGKGGGGTWENIT